MKRRRRMSMFGSSEEFTARQARWAKHYAIEPADAAERRRRALLGGTRDLRVRALYAYCAEWNREHPPHIHISVDHIKLLSQGGIHVYENLRVIPLKQNSEETFRLDADVVRITEIVARDRALYPDKIVIYWPENVQ